MAMKAEKEKKVVQKRLHADVLRAERSPLPNVPRMHKAAR
jgi:hypothetical protein